MYIAGGYCIVNSLRLFSRIAGGYIEEQPEASSMNSKLFKVVGDY